QRTVLRRMARRLVENAYANDNNTRMPSKPAKRDMASFPSNADSTGVGFSNLELKNSRLLYSCCQVGALASPSQGRAEVRSRNPERSATRREAEGALADAVP